MKYSFHSLAETLVLMPASAQQKLLVHTPVSLLIMHEAFSINQERALGVLHKCLRITLCLDCVCVNVCVREGDREMEGERGRNPDNIRTH